MQTNNNSNAAPQGDVGSSVVEGTTQHAPSDNSAASQDPIIEKLKARRAERRAARNAIDVAVTGQTKVVENTATPNNESSQEPIKTQAPQEPEPTVQPDLKQPVPTQPQVEPPKQDEEDPSQKFTQAFTKLTRKERELQERANELKQQEQEMKEFRELIEASKKDPEKFLEHVGWDYDKLTRFKLDQPAKPQQEYVDPKIAELEENQKKLQEQYQKDKDTQAEQRLNAAIQGVKSDISGMIETGKDKYELCNVYSSEAVDIVYNVIDNYYNEHQEILPYEDALQATEDWLLETRVKPVTQANKLRDLLNSKPADNQSNGQPNPVEGQQASDLSNTITNDLSATQPTGEERMLTRAERRELAKKALKWE